MISPTTVIDLQMAPKSKEAAPMSWLSPKRRRTTGNLKSIPNGQVSNGDNDAALRIPGTPPRVQTLGAERPPSTPRPFSQPMDSGAGAGPDGNLFYVYARRGDDLKSRYLLTFASANIANEWWLLVQAHFPDTTRPGPQLFSFRDPDLLIKAWRHERFSHLKSKWMYISFSDTSGNGLGGAAQGIIPVQDSHGNMLGGSAPASPELMGRMGEVQRQARGMQNEITKLEEYFEKMMEAVERNTAQVAVLASSTKEQAGVSGDVGVAGGEGRGAYSDSLSELSSHLSSVNELLKRNNEHVQALAKRQADNDQKLQAALHDMSARQHNDYLDMSQLSSHLDRIQAIMESSIQDRKDSAKEITDQQQSAATQIDLSPLTDRLERVQEAVEQNSALIKALLDEGATADSKPGTPFWGRDSQQPLTVDLTAHNEILEKIHAAIEQQSSHIQALVGFASGDGDTAGSGPSNLRDTEEKSLAPLGEHLEQIYNAIEEGNRHAKEASSKVLPAPKLDVEPLSEQFERMLEAQNAMREAVVSDAGKMDLTPLTTKFDDLLRAHENLTRAVEAGTKSADTGPLGEKLDRVTEHLENLREWIEYQSENVKELLDLQKSDEGKEVSLAKDTINFSPVTDRLDQLLEAQYAASHTAAQPSVDLAPLEKHFEALRTAVEQNSQGTKALAAAQEEAQQKTPSPNINFSPLTDRLNRIHASLERAHSESRDRERSPGLGDAKFLMSALTSHLSKIQAVTEQNAVAVKSLREKQSASQDKMHIAVAETADQLRSLLQRNFTQEVSESDYKSQNDVRVRAMQSQVRELMSGQREMVDCVRELAKSITAQQKGACDHVVIPPPRKVGRKIVGFVYDAKDGPA